MKMFLTSAVYCIMNAYVWFQVCLNCSVVCYSWIGSMDVNINSENESESVEINEGKYLHVN